MLNDDWKNKFTLGVLDGGKAYYAQGNVVSLTKNNNTYEATVAGKSKYKAKITINTNRVTRMTCNCPYAVNGRKCEHIVAAIYAIEDEISGINDAMDEKYELFGEIDKKTSVNLKNRTDNPYDEMENYKFFDFEKIGKSIYLTRADKREALLLINNKQITLSNITQMFRSDNGQPVWQVSGVYYIGEYKYSTVVYVSRDEYIRSECNYFECRGYSYGWYRKEDVCCAHVIALLMLMEKKVAESRIGDSTNFEADRLIKMCRYKEIKKADAGDINDKKIKLIPKLHVDYDEIELSFKIGRDKMYVIKNMTEFYEKVQKNEVGVYGKNTEILHDKKDFDENSQKYLNFIMRNVNLENVLGKRMVEKNRFVTKPMLVGQKICLDGHKLDEFYEMCKDEILECEVDNVVKEKKNISFGKGNPDIIMKIRPLMYKQKSGKDIFDGICAEVQMPYIMSGGTGKYYLDDNSLNKIDDDCMECIESLCELGKCHGSYIRLEIGKRNIGAFYNYVIPAIEEYVNIDDSCYEEASKYIVAKPEFSFYLDSQNDTLECHVKAKYGDREHMLIDEPEYLENNGIEIINDDKEMKVDTGKISVYRETDIERSIIDSLSKWFSEYDYGKKEYICGKSDDEVYRVLTEGIQTLLEMGEVNMTDSFKNLNVAKKPKISVGVRVYNGLLELEISSDDVDREELLQVLKSYRLKKKYHRLKNGDFMQLNGEDIDVLDELYESLHMSPKEFVKGKMKVPAYRGLYLDKLLQEHESVYNKRDSKFRQMVKEFKTVKDADFDVPKSLAKTLRAYQKTGYKWIRLLGANNFGGILADDMGLGKTVQMISAILADKIENSGKTNSDDKHVSLIVCPASLVFNWSEEFARFAPELKVNLITGTVAERKEKIADYNEYDCLITSYDLLKRDIAEYEDIVFRYQVIDEAQYIKNHNTEAAKAVKIIKSQMKYALTGTPIENRLSELWSIFDYLMPGFLYSYDNFKKTFEIPIVKNGDEKATKRLQKMVAPFILRRLKEDVLKDLPDKLEEIQYASFESEQMKLYDAQVAKMKQMIEMGSDEQFQKNKLQVLSELTRLRQICCDPSLCFENYKGESAKRDACMELIESAIDSGHKMLVFSQFTSMLDILKKELTNRKIEFYEITGATPKEKRVKLVKEFNQNDVKVFLISLKAGGTGLNLVGADVVIHYDPWWNQAVQKQATDRAHRIGQTKKVTVYQLIVKNTIEEKIMKIQKRKKDLADQIVTGEVGQLSGMTKEEFMELLS